MAGQHGRECRDRGPDGALRRQAGIRDGDGGGIKGHAGFDEMRREAGNGLPAHVDGERAAGFGQGDPVMGRQPAFRAMAGQKMDGAGDAALGQGQAERRRGGGAGGHARDDFKRDASGAQGIDLLGGTAENAGIAAFQPHHALSCERFPHQQIANIPLRRGAAAATFADVNSPCPVTRKIEDRHVDQTVMQDDVRLAQEARRF